MHNKWDSLRLCTGGDAHKETPFLIPARAAILYVVVYVLTDATKCSAD